MRHNHKVDYLGGEVPSSSNGKTLSVIRNPLVMETQVGNARRQLGKKAYNKEKIAFVKEPVENN